MFVGKFRVRTHSIFLTVAMLAALLIAPPAALGADPVPGADFTLTILHNNDGESQLINAGSGLEDFGGVARFKTLVDGLRADATASGNGVLMLSSGDNFLAGPEFNASVENGVPFYDTIAIEAIGYDAISLGNHDFDFGPDILTDFLTGYVDAPQYLSSNLDFTGEPSLQAFVDSGVIAPSTVVNTGGQDIGIVGAVTPALRSISSPRNVVIDFDVAGAIQTQVDALIAGGVNKIVLISHLQDIDEDIALAAELTGVDVMIAGGGDELLANPGDPLVPGEEDDVFGAYPLTATGGDGAQIPVVTTPGEYKYLGQLSVGFDATGNVIGVGADSGPKVVDGTITPDAALQASVVDPVVAAIATLDATVIGTSEVALDGTRTSVRSVESNEGNLLADALLWQAAELAAGFGVNAPDVAIQNGGGIRNNTVIDAGDVTVLDTFDIAPFPNFVSVIEDIPREQFKDILENAISEVPGGGRFAQIAGFSFVYDEYGIPMVIDDETGAVTQVGNRIVTATLDDGTTIVDGGLVVPGDPVTIATIDFLARGGDEYPYGGAPFTTIGVSYQQALANYITDGLGGTITAADYPEGGEGRITTLPAPTDFGLVIHHNNDGESQLIDAGSGLEGYGGVARFARQLEIRRRVSSDARFGDILLSSGDNFLAGPEFNASLEKGLPFYDTIAMDKFGYDAIAIGNHDFDFGPDVLADFIDGYTETTPPYVSANLDFTGEPRLQALVDAGRIVSSTVINERGMDIGIVGATTPRIDFISSPRNVEVMEDVAGVVQAEVDALTAAGVKIVILISHLQDIDEDIALAAMLSDVDVMIAGGGDELLANPGNPLLPGDEENVFGSYPIVATDADGTEVPVVTTPGEYKYIGELWIGFDPDGNTTLWGGRPVPVRGAPNGEVFDAVTAPVIDALATLDATVIGTSEVALDGTRTSVRGIESNEGNLIADALRWQATELADSFGVGVPDVALQNGGGIRNNTVIAAGDITLLDTFDMVPFPNFVTVLEGIPRDQFKEILENAYSAVPGDGRFAQISGFTVSYDAGKTAQVLNEDGTVDVPGERILTAALDDGTVLVEDGAVVAGDPITIATIDFLARGGDQYPYRGAPFTSVGVSYQQALADYIVDGLGGVISAADYPEGGEGRISAADIVPIEGPFTPIYEIQGSGDASPLDGTAVEVTGTVTGVFPDLGGFYLQDGPGDGDATTSDGIFVAAENGVAVGDRAEVRGVVTEFFDETQITDVTAIEVEDTGGAVTATAVTLPLADGASLEAFEGMLVTFPEYLFVSDTFNLHRFGETLLASGGVLVNPTDVAEPGDAANAVAAANAARSIVLDDGSGSQFPDEVPYTVNGQRRRGDAAKDITGAVSFSFGAYKIQPTAAVEFVEMNPRPETPDDVGGNLQVASFNVLNFFSTIDDGENGARGADSEAEKAAQLTKLVAAINGLGADIVALQEIENNGPVAIGELVDGLNAAYGAGTWAAAADPDYPGGLESTNAIKVGIIFKTASVTPVGGTEVSEDPVFGADRPPIAHSFSAFGDTFTVINNHFKSKSSRDAEGPDLDQGDGQGAYNARRTAQAGALLDFTLELVGATGDGDVLVIGDFNSYSNEDPIAVLEGSGFLANLVKERLAPEDSYSLVFFGAQGLLDGAFATSTLDPKVTGIDIWHINADEPRVLQYNDDIVDPAERSSDFNQPVSQPDEFSSSDHDPILVGLQLGGGEQVASGLYGPRHIGMGPDGTLYVAESGAGGADPCVIGGAGDEECFGLTGAVTAITDGTQSRIATGLPSLAAEGFAALGTSDVAVAADGTIRALIGLGQDPAVRDEVLTPAGGGAFGQVVNIGADGSATPILDVAAFEAANNPDGGVIDSNPNALIRTDDGYLIVDSGGNALLKFDGTSLSTLAVFPTRLVPAPPFIPDPEIPMDAVPTSVTMGPDGYAYVGQLTGFPFPVGGANVYRVDPATGEMSVFAGGFTNIIDLEFGPTGDLFVVQISSSSLLFNELDGAVIKVAPDGSREVFFDELFAPTGIAIDQTTGDVYVSNCGICPGFGEVLRLDGEAPGPISLGYSASNDRAAPQRLDGATVAGKIYPFVLPLDPGLGFTTVDFYLNGVKARTEYLAPYDFAGGLLTMATAWDSTSVGDGEHTIKAVGNLPDGGTIETSATFTVDNGPAAADFTMAFSESAYRTDPVMLEGAHVRGVVYPFVYPLFPEGYESFGTVSFYLDGEFFHTEYLVPYDFVSGGTERANESWDSTTVADGVHTIMVKANRRGAPPLVTTVTFNVSNDTPPPPPPPPPPPQAIRFATFNASLNRSNTGDLVADLSTPDNAQAKVIAEIIQRTRPEVLLLNEFDYDAGGEGARLFQENYLSVSQNGAEPIVYDYAFSAPSNTGIPSGLDLDNSGDVGGPGDAFGFGFFEGQFGMQVYSQHPIDFANVRTFQNFLWADMPGALLPVDPATGEGWYSDEELESVRLSSKSHWDVPIVVGDGVVNFLVSHPTPPVFDGLEDRNGTRNSDEIRFWRDYADGAPYFYDDNGGTGGWSGDYFVIAGDLNSDPNDGDSLFGSIQQLLDLPRVNTSVTPSSAGAVEQDGLQGGANLAHTGDPAHDTADFNDNPAPGNLRADYVLPSNNLAIADSGVFWPESTDPLFSLVGTFPFPGSDHRMVWVDLLPGDEELADSVGPPDDEFWHFDVTVENLTDGQPLTPPIVIVHDPAISAFTVGGAAPIGVQELAENGNGVPFGGFFTSRLSQVSDGTAGTAPLVPAADPGGSGFAASETFGLHGRATDVITLGSMLICTNDGFVALNGAALPGDGETLVYDLVAYDAGTETNTEDFADMVPPCQGLIGVSSDDPGTGATNPDLAEGGVIGAHAGIVGGNDLDPAVHGWTDPVARVTITHSEPPPFELTGEIDGAPYRILAPANPDDWNGVLLAYAHGYQDALDHPSEGTDRGRVDAAPGGEAAEAALLAEGFALAGSEYKTDGWAVEDGIVDTEALIDYFGDNVAPPEATVLWGFSMGSVIAAHAAENSDSVDGVIAACFVGAGAPRAADGGLALLIAYDAAFGFPAAWGTPGDVRDDLDFDTEVLPVVGSQLFANPLDPSAGLNPANVGLFTFIQMVSGIPAEDFFTEWLLTDMFFATEARAEIERRAGGSPVGNVDHVYSVTAEDRTALAALGLDDAAVDGLLAAMNAMSYTPDAAARAYLEANYEYTGAIDKPVLTIHTTVDGLVVVENESAYAETVTAAGASDLLVQTYTDTYPPGTSSGHCTFTPEQLEAAVRGMLGWLFTGTAPGPEAFPEAVGFVPGFMPGPWPQPPPSPPAVAPDIIALPNGFQPEGVAIGQGTDLFVGSLGRLGDDGVSVTGGAIYKADLLTGLGAELVPAAPGKVAVGMDVDPRSNYLWVAGGPFGNAFVYDADTGAALAEVNLNGLAPFETLVNDVAVTEDAVYLTDSFRPYFYRVDLEPDGAIPDPVIVTEIPLGDGFPFIPGGINSNGIVEANGSLIINHTDEGKLFRVDHTTGDATEIDLGGASVPSGDGLVLDGSTLYVVQNFLNQIGVVELDAGFGSGTLIGTITSPNFRIPTTAAQSNGYLYAVNARFDVAPPPFPGSPPADPTTEFDVVRVSKDSVTPIPPIGPNIVDSIVKAPIVPDGDVAGAVTDFVINLDRSMDPSVDGRSLAAGDYIKITLPEDFINNGFDTGAPGAANCMPGPCNLGVLLQGWPQHPIAPPAAKYSLTMEGTHTFVYTALEDLGPAGADNPGIKQMHLILLGFTNPEAGDYEITVEAQTGSDGGVETGTGILTIRPAIVPSINVTSVFNEGTPNTIYQTNGTGQAAPFAYDFLLWDATGSPMTGVSLEDGILMRDGARVGEVSIAAPDGATGQAVGVAAPSAEITGPVLMVPTARLTAQFTAGDLPGLYTATFSLDGGTSVTMFVAATAIPEPPASASLAATLDGASEVPGPGDADGTGSAMVAIDGTTVTWSITVSAITMPTAAHIHVGASDASGGVVVNLLGDGAFMDNGDGSFTASGAVETDADTASAIAADPGGYYVNVHNAEFAPGAVRGQLAAVVPG